MNNPTDIKPLSEALSEPIVRAYKVGGYGLAFVFAGTLLLIISLFFGQDIFRYVISGIGSLMILTVLALFYFQDIKRLKDISDDIKENKDLIDTVQETAIQMTELSSTLQSLAFKNADQIASVVTFVRKNAKSVKSASILTNIPGLHQLVNVSDNQYIVRAEDLSKSIVNTTSRAKAIIDDINMALVKSDPKLLKKYLILVKKINIDARKLLEK